jgi:aminoglycoside phosphotransferase (APT) family kinase protein
LVTETGSSPISRRLADATNISVIRDRAHTRGAFAKPGVRRDLAREQGCSLARLQSAATRRITAETDHVEFRIYQAGPVPVPPMYWIEQDGATLERPFFVMGRMPGQANAGILLAPNYPGSVEEIARQKAEILARIHRADWQTLGVGEFLGPEPSVETAAQTEIDRWERITRQMRRAPAGAQYAVRWLKRKSRSHRYNCRTATTARKL